jgi:Fe-S-cluster-containing hydrogenase component 2
MCVMVCPFGAPQPFRQFRKMLKCDRCTGMDAPFCVESCPTHALLLLDPAEVARGAIRIKGGGLAALNFASTRTLCKP